MPIIIVELNTQLIFIQIQTQKTYESNMRIDVQDFVKTAFK